MRMRCIFVAAMVFFGFRAEAQTFYGVPPGSITAPMLASGAAAGNLTSAQAVALLTGQPISAASVAVTGIYSAGFGNFTATGTDQSTAAPVTGQTITITSGTGGILLSGYLFGTLPVSVANVSGSSQNIYPNTGEVIIGYSVNAPYVLDNNTQIFLTRGSPYIWFVK